MDPEADPNLGRTLAGGAGWNVLARSAPVVVNLALTPYLIHGIGLTRYGIYSLAASLTLFLGTFDGGLSITTQRFLALHAGRQDRVAATRLLCTSLCLILAGGAAVVVADWYLAPTLCHLFRLPRQYRAGAVFLLRTFGVLIVVSLAHSVLVALLQAHQRFKLTSTSVILSYLAWAGGVVWAVHSGTGLQGISLALILEQAVASALVLPFVFRYVARPGLGLLTRTELRNFLGFAVRVQTVGFSNLVNLQFDTLIIGAFLPVRMVGLYNAGANPASQLRWVATDALVPTANRLASTFARGGEGAALDEMRRFQRVWVVLTTAWCSAALGGAYYAVVSWLGPGFRTAALVCTILLAGHAFSVLTGMMTVYAGAVGNPGVETRYGVVAMVTNVVLTIPLVFVGVFGVVGATAFGSAVGSVYLLRAARRRLGPDVPSFFADVPVVAGALCFGVTFGLETLAHQAMPEGPLGLVLSGMVTLPGLIVFVWAWLGLRRSKLLVQSLRTRRPSLEMLLGATEGGGVGS